jgi:hypothetical protein
MPSHHSLPRAVSRFSLMVLLLACLFQATPPAKGQIAQDAKTRVIVIGTIHSNHESSAPYSLDVLRRALIAMKPDQILAEIPPERVAVARAEFRATGRITEPRVSVFPEYVDVVFPLTTSQKFELVGVAGWTQQISDVRDAELKRIAADSALRSQWRAHRQAYATYERAVGSRGGDPLFIHTPAYDLLVERAQSPYERYFNKYLGGGGWTSINKAHYSLISHALDRVRGGGKTIAITFGSWHKYLILRELAKRGDVVIVDPKPYFVTSKP